MPKRHVYSKDITGLGEFIYVDLLPDIKRTRSFNVNVIASLLIAIVLAFFLIYIPYRDGTFELENAISLNNDLQHEYTLTEEEFDGYEIDLSAIRFEDNIETIEQLQVDFNNLMDFVELIVDERGGRIRTVEYDADDAIITLSISVISEFRFNSINDQLLNLSWVKDSEYSEPTRTGDGVEYTSSFVIEVEYDVE